MKKAIHCIHCLFLLIGACYIIATADYDKLVNSLITTFVSIMINTIVIIYKVLRAWYDWSPKSFIGIIGTFSAFVGVKLMSRRKIKLI
jgi:hypothetical protein